MLKQVIMPVVIKTGKYEAFFIANGNPDALNRQENRRALLAEQVVESEREMNTLLNDGYIVIAQTQIDTNNYGGTVFFFWKADGGNDANI